MQFSRQKIVKKILRTGSDMWFYRVFGRINVPAVEAAKCGKLSKRCMAYGEPVQGMDSIVVRLKTKIETVVEFYQYFSRSITASN